MSKASKVLATALEGAQLLLKAAQVSPPKVATRSKKGTLLPAVLLLTKRFNTAVSNALAGLEIADNELRALGIKGIEDFRRVLVQARRMLDEKVTADHWLGAVIEIVAPQLPEIEGILDAATKEYVTLANRYISQKKRGFTFINAYYEMAGVSNHFSDTQSIYNVRIKKPGDEKGVKYVDRASLILNADGQALFATAEIKSRAAGKKLRKQVAARDERLFGREMPEGTKLTYNVVGKPGTYEVDFEKVILMRETDNIILSRPEEFFGKVGIRAGSVARWKLRAYVAKDAEGGKYIRIVVPLATASIRRVLIKLLRDKSWQ